MPENGIGSTIVFVVVMLLVLFAAYYVTKVLSLKSANLTKGKYMQVKDRMFLGRDKMIVLLKAGEKILIVGITNQNMSLIGTLNKDEIEDEMEDAQADSIVFSMKALFEKCYMFIKKACDAPQELKKARKQRKNEKNIKDEQEQADDIEKLLEAINNRNSRFYNKKD